MAEEPVVPEQTPPVTPPPADTVTIPKADYDRLLTRLDVFDQRLAGFSTPQAPPTPPTPPGPTLSDQLSEIDQTLEIKYKKLDECVASSQPVSQIQREIAALQNKRTSLELTHTINAQLEAGIATIDQLTDKISSADMPFLAIKEVKTDYDQIVRGLPAQQRMSPKVREMAYNAAVGQNSTKVIDFETDRRARAATPPNTQMPGSSTGRSTPSTDPNKVPKPEEALPPEALSAIRNRGISVDRYYEGLGYTGWEDFWKKDGKEYFSEGGAA